MNPTIGNSSPPNRDTESLADQLARLHDLHRQGALSQEEYAAAKQQVLAGGPASPRREDQHTSPPAAHASSADKWFASEERAQTGREQEAVPAEYKAASSRSVRRRRKVLLTVLLPIVAVGAAALGLASASAGGGAGGLPGGGAGGGGGGGAGSGGGSSDIGLTVVLPKTNCAFVGQYLGVYAEVAVAAGSERAVLMQPESFYILEGDGTRLDPSPDRSTASGAYLEAGQRQGVSLRFDSSNSDDLTLYVISDQGDDIAAEPFSCSEGD